jgi:hypothetical protein
MGDYGPALKFIGENVASGALSTIGSDGAGWILGAIFGTSSGPSNQQLLDAIQGLGKQLTSIQNALAYMQADLDKNFAEIEQQLQQINEEQLYLSWQVADQQISDYITQINTQYSTYAEYACNSTTTTQGEVTDLVSQITNTNDGAKVSLNGINSYVLGGGQSKSVFALWVAMITPLMQNGTIPYSGALASYMAYATKILYAQMQAINLIVEAYNEQGSNTNAQSEYGLYQTVATSQETAFLSALEQLQFNAIVPGASFAQGQPGGPYYVAWSYDYFSLLQGLYAGANYITTYCPTPARMAAEQLLAYAQAPKPGDRRIVVWMIYDASQTGIAPQGDYSGVVVPIQISSSAAAAGPVNPDATTTITTSALYLLPYWSAPTTPWTRITRRNVFTSIGDGAYTLFDMNATYPPITGSNQATDYFMDPTVYLTYAMRVDAGQPFDFMDFSIYCDPNQWAAQFSS